jgi:hypothetical protein
VVHLTGSVKYVIDTPHQVVHGELVPDIGELDLHPVFYLFDVEEIATLPGQHVVDDRHMSAQLNQFNAEVAPDEAEPSGNKHLFTL